MKKTVQQIQDDEKVTDSHISDKHRNALVDLWTVNPQLRNLSPLPEDRPLPTFKNVKTRSLIRKSSHNFNQFLGKKAKILPLSRNLQVRNNRRMPYFPIGFGDLNTDGLFHTITIRSNILDADLRKIRPSAPYTLFNEWPPSKVQILATKWHFETPDATVELHFENRDILFKKHFIGMTNLNSRKKDCFSHKKNSSTLYMRQGVLIFNLLSTQLIHADNTYSKQTNCHLHWMTSFHRKWGNGLKTTLSWSTGQGWPYHLPRPNNHPKTAKHSANQQHLGASIHIENGLLHRYFLTTVDQAYQTQNPPHYTSAASLPLILPVNTQVPFSQKENATVNYI